MKIMVDPLNDSRGENLDSNLDDFVVCKRVRELTWALLDDQITGEEVALLENLLLSDDKARDSYLGCVQLHAGLVSYFAEPQARAAKESAASPQVLGFLKDVTPLGFGCSSEEAAP